MRDWEQYVRAHLSLPDLTPEREARIRREQRMREVTQAQVSNEPNHKVSPIRPAAGTAATG